MITVRRDKEIYDIEGGWFHARWHFSFDRYHDPEWTQFGSLRDQEEVVSDAMMLFSAGRVTLRKLIPAVLWHLLRQGTENLAALRQEVQAGPGLLAMLTEEGLRWGTPTTRVARWTTHEVSLGGQVIPAGEKVFALLEAANVDDRCFPAATRFGAGWISGGIGIACGSSGFIHFQPGIRRIS